MKSYFFQVAIEKDKQGYFAYNPSLQGCYTQEDSYEEVLENIQDAMRLHLGDRPICGEPIPEAQSISVTTLEVAV